MGRKKITLDNKNCTFSDEEYKRLNNELLERMRGIFTHGFSIISMVGLLWTITATLIANYNLKDNLCGSDATFFFAGLVVFLFGAPSFVLYPFSVKYRDNLRVIANLSSYIKVFFEYPLLLGKHDTNGKNAPRMSWETMHCGAKYGVKKLFGFEYGAAAIVSDILAALSFIYILSLGRDTNGFIAFLVFGIVYLIFLTYTTIMVCLNSRSTEPLFTYNKEYFLVYLSEATESGFLSKDEAIFCIKNQIKTLMRDSYVSNNLRKSKRKNLYDIYFNEGISKYKSYVRKNSEFRSMNF
ncbi:MAG: hypothetical protein IJY23_08600 [Clostridia bacterium]|nr:hypothetical protein [Clostridia bacterium]